MLAGNPGLTLFRLITNYDANIRNPTYNSNQMSPAGHTFITIAPLNNTGLEKGQDPCNPGASFSLEVGSI